MARAARTAYGSIMKCYRPRAPKRKSSGISISGRTHMKPLWRKCSVTFPAINFWVLGLRHNQTETRAGIAVLCRILAFVDTALGRRVGLHARISRGTGTRWSARNCRPYCGVALLLVRSADGGCHVLRERLQDFRGSEEGRGHAGRSRAPRRADRSAPERCQ